MLLEEINITRTVNGAPADLIAYNADVDVHAVVTGQYLPETTRFPAEYPSVDLVSVTLAKPLALYDEDLRIVDVLPVGTDISIDLTDSQVQYIIKQELEEIAA